MANDTSVKLAGLRDFFLSEVKLEVRSGFGRLQQIPSSDVMNKLRYFGTLNPDDQTAFLDCCAYWASVAYGFVVGMKRLDPAAHPFFSKWSRGPMWTQDFENVRSVPLLRAMVQQYKIDQSHKRQSHVTKEQFDYACSIHCIKAPELRKRVRAALKPFGHYETDSLGNYWCRVGETKFFVHLDFGGSNAQLRYCVVRPEFDAVHYLSQFRFERAVGFGLGDWDYIVEENVADVFAIFPEIVQYCFDLPDRIRTAVKL